MRAHIHQQTVPLTDFPDGISPSQRAHAPTANNETEALRTAATKEILFDYQTLGSFLKCLEGKIK